MGLDAGSGLVGLESTSTVSCRTFRTFSSVGSGLPVTPFFWRASEIARIPVAVNIKTPIHTIWASQFHGRFCVHSITPSLPECVRPLGNQTSLRFMESLLTRYRSEPHGRNKAPNEPLHRNQEKRLPPREHSPRSSRPRLLLADFLREQPSPAHNNTREKIPEQGSAQGPLTLLGQCTPLLMEFGVDCGLRD